MSVDTYEVQRRLTSSPEWAEWFTETSFKKALTKMRSGYHFCGGAWRVVKIVAEVQP